MEIFKRLIVVCLLVGLTQAYGQSNNCSTATPLTVSSACVLTAGTSLGATQSIPGCVGTADDDVWYSFVANNTSQTITVVPSASYDPVVNLYSGACASLSTLSCMDNGFTGDNEVINAVGLTIGATYYIRVYHYYAGSGSNTFQICVQGTAPTAIPSNNEPCNAIALPTVTSECNYLSFTTVNATATASAPAPASCGGSSPFQGGWSGTSKDVWFTVVVPSNGKLVINAEPSGGTITDGVMALYSGTCGALTQIECDDDDGPGLLPLIVRSGLTPGATIYVRFWGYGSSSGTFGICASSPLNDNCSSSLYICDLNGYSGTTSAGYTADRPGNMYGNNETAAGVDQPDGVNTGGPFGTGQTGAGTPNVNIDNNSWITFTAAATSATLNVNISDCWSGYGIQMQVFSGTNCASFVPVSTFAESPTSITLTATGLTVGNTYYLMIDGFAGDVCSYSISASGGVAFPDITSSSSGICDGATATLTGPSGASSYSWSPGGATTQSITVSPASTTTYTLIAGGVCGYKQTLTSTVTVYNPLNGGTIAANQTICYNGDPLTLTNSVSPSGGTGTWTYEWEYSTGCTGTWTAIPASNSLTYNPPAGLTATTCYRRSAINSCGPKVYSNTITVTVNPALTGGTIGSNETICYNGNPALISDVSSPTGGSGAWTYEWEYSTGCTGTWTAIPASNALTYDPPAGLTATTCYRRSAINSCGPKAYSNTITVTVYQALNGGTIGSAQSICNNGDPALLTDVSSPSGGTGTWTYEWEYSTGCTGTWTAIASSNSLTYDPPSGLTATTCYRRSAVNSCGPKVYSNSITVTVYNALTGGTISVDQTICSGDDPAALSSTVAPAGGTGAWTYEWEMSTGCTGTWTAIPSTNTLTYDPAALTSTTCYRRSAINTCGPKVYSNTITITVNPLPSITSTSSTNVTLCNASDGTITITATGQATLEYSINGGTNYSTSGSFTGLPDASYPVMVKNGFGCTVAGPTITIQNGGAPAAPAAGTDSTYCSGQTLANMTATPLSGGTITWYADAALTTVLNTGLTHTPSNTLGATNYYVTETFGGCRSTATVVTININTPAQVNAGSNSTICAGSTYTLSGTQGGSTSSVTWSTSTGGTFDNANSLTATYTPSATDISNGGVTLTLSSDDPAGPCSAVSDDIFIQIDPTPTSPVITYSNNDTICQGQSTTITASGSTGGTISYNFYDQSSGGSILGTSPFTVSPSATTTYYLEVINTNNCTSSPTRTPVTIAVNPTPTPASVVVSNDTICSGDATTIYASGSTGGVVSYNFYDQSTGGTFLGADSITVSPASTTTYYLEVVNSSGCLSSSTRTSVTIEVNPTPTPATITISNDTICSGDSTTITASGSTGGSVTYNFYDQATAGTLIGTTSITVAPSATSTYYLEVVNSSSCLSSTTRTPVTIEVNPTPTPPTISVSNDTICSGDTTTISASGSTGGTISYNFYDQAAGGTLLGNSPLTVNPSITTTYYLEVINSTNCLSSSTRTPVTIEVNPTPTPATVTITNDTICSGDLTTIYATSSTGGTISYNFFDQATAGTLLGSDSITVNPSATTTYYLEVINSSGCLSSPSRTPVTIEVNPTPTPATVTVSNDTICSGESTTITAIGSTGGTISYNFYDMPSGGIFIGGSPLTVTPSATTTYYLEVINSNNCVSSTTRTPVTIEVNPTPTPATVSISNDTICSGESATITASGSTGGTITYNFYDQANGGTLLGSSPLTVSPANTTTYYLEVINSANCMSSATRTPVTIEVNPTPTPATITLSDDTICQGETATITASGSVGGTVSYNFYDQASGGIFLGTSPLTVSPSATTTYWLEVINSSNCLSSSGRTPVTINVDPTPTPATVTLSNDTICEGSSTVITASGSTGGTIFYNFYDQPAGGTLLGNSPLTVSPVITTTYYLEVINSNNCKSSSTRTPVQVFVNPAASDPVIANGTTICSGTAGTIQASSNGQVNWHAEATGGTALATGSSFTTPLLQASTTYYAEAVSSQGCTNLGGRTPATVTVNPTPEVTITADPSTTIVTGQTITFTADPAGYDFYDFVLNNSSVQSGSSNQWTSNIFVNGDILTVKVTDGLCNSLTTDSIIINVKPLPNAFTPNGDGKNDRFIKGLDVTILNRWGQQLFSGTEGWDGTYNGKPVTPGTYYYIIRLKDPDGEERIVKGPLTLIAE